MSHAFLEWRELDGQLAGDVRKGYVSAIVYCALSLHVASMKLFLSGYIIPAGNLQRQAIETIALASLTSANQLGVLDHFVEGKYSTNRAIKDALRHYKKLRLNAEGVRVLRQLQQFYHNYSHPSRLTIAHHSTSEGFLSFGTSFDERKLAAYRKEVAARVSLASIFKNFVKGVRLNLSS